MTNFFIMLITNRYQTSLNKFLLLIFLVVACIVLYTLTYQQRIILQSGKVLYIALQPIDNYDIQGNKLKLNYILSFPDRTSLPTNHEPTEKKFVLL